MGKDTYIHEILMIRIAVFSSQMAKVHVRTTLISWGSEDVPNLEFCNHGK